MNADELEPSSHESAQNPTDAQTHVQLLEYGRGKYRWHPRRWFAAIAVSFVMIGGALAVRFYEPPPRPPAKPKLTAKVLIGVAEMGRPTFACDATASKLVIDVLQRKPSYMPGLLTDIPDAQVLVDGVGYHCNNGWIYCHVRDGRFFWRDPGITDLLRGLELCRTEHLALVRLVTGPQTTHTNSSTISTLSERATFLDQYVKSQQRYESLDFDISYQNNTGGIVPGPPVFDIRVVAVLPMSELEAWVPRNLGPLKTTPDTKWLTSVLTKQVLTGVTEWYDEGQRTIGLDRTHRILVYRDRSH